MSQNSKKNSESITKVLLRVVRRPLVIPCTQVPFPNWFSKREEPVGKPLKVTTTKWQENYEKVLLMKFRKNFTFFNPSDQRETSISRE